LNVGPTAEGLFPKESVERLKDIGEWMKLHSESIYATQASPFRSLDFGKCTQKAVGNGTRLYFHLFEWPEDRELIISGLDNDIRKAFLLSTGERLDFNTFQGDIIIDISGTRPDRFATVIAVDIDGIPVIHDPPILSYNKSIFVDSVTVSIIPDSAEGELHYTIDGSDPSITSTKYTGPVILKEDATLIARNFIKGKPVSARASAQFHKVEPVMAINEDESLAGFNYSYYEGDWNKLPDFSKLEPGSVGISDSINLSPRLRDEYYGFVFDGFIWIPKNGIYRISLNSDDGSRLFLNGDIELDNDGLHGMLEKSMEVPLARGIHSLRVEFFEKTGYDELEVSWECIEP
jgi:alpha-L-fucosidase